ncbi:hypothetical protein [Leuconostoc pseudomesenteroides]
MAVSFTGIISGLSVPVWSAQDFKLGIISGLSVPVWSAQDFK